MLVACFSCTQWLTDTSKEDFGLVLYNEDFNGSGKQIHG